MTARGDLYALLGVPRDATAAEIRWSYERALNQANKNGAIRHAAAVAEAFETLSDPRRRATYDRHGLLPLRERSPGAAAPPTPWRHEQNNGVARTAAMRQYRARWPFVLLAGIVIGVTLTILSLTFAAAP